jgi:hypothetical protein
MSDKRCPISRLKELPLLAPPPAIFGLLLYGTDPRRYELEGHLHVYETLRASPYPRNKSGESDSVMLGLRVAAGGTQMSLTKSWS